MSMRSWDITIPVDGGHPGAPGWGAPAIALVGAGLVELRPVSGLRGCPAAANNQRTRVRTAVLKAGGGMHYHSATTDT